MLMTNESLWCGCLSSSWILVYLVYHTRVYHVYQVYLVYQVYQFTSWSKSENFLANFADMGSFENRKWSKNMLGLHKTIEISTNIITDRRKKVNSTLEKSVQQVSNVLFIFSGISWIKSYGWFCHSSIWIKIEVDIGASGISWSPKFEWRWTNTLLL